MNFSFYKAKWKIAIVIKAKVNPKINRNNRMNKMFRISNSSNRIKKRKRRMIKNHSDQYKISFIVSSSL